MIDYRLTREGVHATIQGGDPSKPAVAAGWAYFRGMTRVAEGIRDMDSDLQTIVGLTVSVQRTRDEQKRQAIEQERLAIEQRQLREQQGQLKGELIDIVAEVVSVQDDVAGVVSDVAGVEHRLGNLESLADLDCTKADTTAKELAHYCGAKFLTFHEWLRDRDITYRDPQTGEIKVHAEYMIAPGYKCWAEAKRDRTAIGPKYAPYFTALGVAEIRRRYNGPRDASKDNTQSNAA